jgi:hypothetical protein
LESGLRCFLREPLEPNWQAYEEDNNWNRNAQLVAQALGLEPEQETIPP